MRFPRLIKSDVGKVPENSPELLMLTSVRTPWLPVLGPLLCPGVHEPEVGQIGFYSQKFPDLRLPLFSLGLSYWREM